MKKVFGNNDDLVKTWVKQSQYFGRGNNMLFLKDGIFSYGYHCKAARMYIVNGRQFALVNNHKYSQTTNRHLSKIKQALDKAGIPFYVVADVDELPSEYLAKAV